MCSRRRWQPETGVTPMVTRIVSSGTLIATSTRRSGLSDGSANLTTPRARGGPRPKPIRRHRVAREGSTTTATQVTNLRKQAESAADPVMKVRDCATGFQALSRVAPFFGNRWNVG